MRPYTSHHLWWCTDFSLSANSRLTFYAGTLKVQFVRKLILSLVSNSANIDACKSGWMASDSTYNPKASVRDEEWDSHWKIPVSRLVGWFVTKYSKYQNIKRDCIFFKYILWLVLMIAFVRLTCYLKWQTRSWLPAEHQHVSVVTV